MATRRSSRRPRGTLLEPAKVHWEVEKAAKDKFDAIADRLELSGAQFFEYMVEHLELTDQGVPVWWPEQDRSEELPINDI
jgi:hypothetical protein